MLQPAFRTLDPTDIKISHLVGLETYKALYSQWPELYSYISNPLVPTNYFNNLVQGVVATSGLSYDVAGNVIKQTLADIANEVPESEIPPKNFDMITPLLNSSYKVENLKSTFWENVIWISIVVFLSFFIIIYLHMIGFWKFIINDDNGINCYDCGSVFDKLFLF